MATQLTITGVQTWLTHFGYYDGTIDGDPTNPEFRADLKKFQYDYRAKAGGADGIYGPKTESALLPLVNEAKKVGTWTVKPTPPTQTDKPPPYSDIGQLRRWRLTKYWINDSETGDIPMYRPNGDIIERLSPRSFASAALEGTIYGPHKELINVAGSTIAVDADTYQPVYDYADSHPRHWIPDKAGYAGIRIANGKVTRAATFEIVPGGPNGYPIWRNGIEGLPFKTIATDTGRMHKDDPTFKGKGGVIPAGTWVFVLELYGMTLPDGTVHDGWVQANDTGSAIYGAHLDLFIGHTSNQSVKIPNLGSVSNGLRCHIWYEGISKLPIDYSYGL